MSKKADPNHFPGYPPFTAGTVEEVWSNVLKHKETLERPVYEGSEIEYNISDKAWDLIKR
jgi:hypothetical protein